MSELKPCPFCGGEAELCYSEVDTFCRKCNVMQETELWNTRPIEDELRARSARLEAENVNLSKKVTDYEKELRQSYKYDKTCSTCRYLDENRDCVLGIRCVNYTLWQGKIL